MAVIYEFDLGGSGGNTDSLPKIQNFLGLGGGINMYAMVKNNPVAWIDPLGFLRGITPPSNNEAAYICQGGQLTVKLNRAKGKAYEKCAIMHEQEHIKDMKRKYGENVCANIADGKQPGAILGDSDYSDWQNWLGQSECKAYLTSRECLRRMYNCGVLSDDAKKEVKKVMDDHTTYIESNLCNRDRNTGERIPLPK